VDRKVQKDSVFTVGDKPRPPRECAIADAITKAEQILKRIDERWPSQKES